MGSFGQVFLVSALTGGEQRAGAGSHKDGLPGAPGPQQELELLQECNHANVLALRAHFLEKNDQGETFLNPGLGVRARHPGQAHRPRGPGRPRSLCC